MNFFPPSQLPPMNRGREEPSGKRSPGNPVTARRYVTYLLSSTLLGLGLAATGYYFFGSPLWLLVLPIAFVAGWYLASNNVPALEAPSQFGNDGPVLW